MAQKPVLRGEVGARALRVWSEMKLDGQVWLCNTLDCGGRGFLKPVKACGDVESTSDGVWWRGRKTAAAETKVPSGL